MKKLLYLFSLLAIASVVIFFGCKKDVEPVPPSIALVTPGITGDATMDPGELFMVITSSTKGDKNLSSFTITKDGVNLSGYPVNISGGSYSDTLIAIADLNALSYVYTFTVTDKDNQSASASITITVATFASAKTGQFYHQAGATGCTGGYNLVGDVDVPGSGVDADRDMLNTDAAGAGFKGSWDSKNSTMYVKDNTYDYANASPKSADAAYAAGTPTVTITAPVASDIFIAKLRGGTDYAVIQITSVSPTDDSCSPGTLNPGKILFGYKKK